jgi:hypothetical protein
MKADELKGLAEEAYDAVGPVLWRHLANETAANRKRVVVDGLLYDIHPNVVLVLVGEIYDRDRVAFDAILKLAQYTKVGHAARLVALERGK